MISVSLIYTLAQGYKGMTRQWRINQYWDAATFIQICTIQTYIHGYRERTRKDKLHVIHHSYLHLPTGSVIQE